MNRFFAMICALLMLAMCVGSASADGLNIVCTSFPCYDFARAVAQDTADIHMLMKPGSEVHVYEPTPSDIMAIAGCDLFVCIGGESDAWVEDILESFGMDAPQTLRLMECVQPVEVAHEGGHHHEAEYDEHIWTSPVNAMRMVETVKTTLCALDSENAPIYEANCAAYMHEISRIDEEIRAIVADAARTELVFADRFPFIYFTREYGLSYMSAFPSCAAESEPSAKTMAELIQKVVRDAIPAVYTIELSSGRTAQTIYEETGAEVLTLHSVQTVSETDFSAGESYVSLMERNVEALRKGLS